MRTALIAWDYPPAPSGLSTAAREIAESLQTCGADVTVLTLDRTGTSEVGGVRIVGAEPETGGGIARLRLWGGVGHLAAPLAVRRAILAEHARAPFDVVEATNWYAPAALLPGGRPSRSSPATRPRRLLARGGIERARPVRRLGGRPAGADPGARQPRPHLQHGRTRTADRGGIRPRRGRPATCRDRPQPRARHAGPRGAASYPDGGSPIRLLFVGRPEHRKGFDAILGATEILAREAASGALPAFEIRLAGVDPDALAPDLPEAVRARLAPLGRLHENDLAREYEAAHAVLAPSRYESFGLVYQEGMAYGRPMVASSEDASAREFVGSTGAGSMARETTGAALAEAMRPVIADPALRRSLRARALQAAGRFTRETLGRETLALYEQAVARFQARKG